MAERNKPSRWRRGLRLDVAGPQEERRPGDEAPLENPYVGPRPFEASESALFFGRRREVRKLASLLVARRAVLLYAQSGAGKTSLLQAGLGPHLEEAKGYRVLPAGRVGGDLPPGIKGARVGNLYAFNTLLNMLGAEAQPQALQSLSLNQGLGTYFGLESGAEGPVLLVLDQLEELFTSHPARYPERAAFFHQLMACLDDYAQLSLVLALREDYLAQLDDYASLLLDRLRARLRMERLGYAAALSAVEEPAWQAERSFEAGVAEALVANLAGTEAGTEGQAGLEAPGVTVEPVHLQIVCHRLWERVPAGQAIILARDVDEFGDVDEALKGLYEEALREAMAKTEAGEGPLRAWFAPPLITPSGTRGLVYRDEQRGETQGLPNDAVDLLYNAYLIRAVKRGRDTWYELAHDRLVAPILESNRTWELEQARLRPPEIVSFEVEPWLVSEGGEVTFTWQVEGADRVVLQPVGQEVPSGGSLTVTPAKTGEYWLEARKGESGAVESRRPEVVVHEFDERMWHILVDRICDKKAVPVIGGSFVYDYLFGDVQALARAWSDRFGLSVDAPLDLAQVASFLEVQDRRYARKSYDELLKSTLLHRMVGEEGVALPELQTARRDLTFSEIVRKVGILDREPEGVGDPFRILARLPFPMYVTTSYHELMEAALEQVGKRPRSERFPYPEGKEPSGIPGEPYRLLEYEPTVRQPLVYHFYGLDSDPKSWVLSEEDYLDYLSAVRVDLRRWLPDIVAARLATSSLLFLGFDVQDWEFRALWHGVFRQLNLDTWKMLHAFQATARGKNREIANYTRAYLGSHRVDVYWGEPEAFLRGLWERYKEASG